LETAAALGRLRQVNRVSLSRRNGTRSDPDARSALTNRRSAGRQTARMDEPTYAGESVFWDQVADWLLGAPAPDRGPMSQDDIEAILRHEEDDRDAH
jgi:hypothetical protein